MPKQNEKAGILRKAGRVATKVGKFYLWTVTGNFDERKREFRRLKDGVHRILNRKFRTETFDEAVSRKGITDQQLQDQAKYLAAMAFLYALVAGIAFLFLLGAGYTPHPMNHLLMATGVFCLALTKFLGCRFRVAQIKRRQLFSFGTWITGRAGVQGRQQ